MIEVMNQAQTMKHPTVQFKYIIERAIDNVYENPEVFRFDFHLQTQPEADKKLIKYSRFLVEENARHFEFQCKIFEKLGASDARKRSLYFSSTLQRIMLMISIYPEQFPIEEIKEQIVEDFCG